MPRDYGIRKGLEHPMFQPFFIVGKRPFEQGFCIDLILE